MKGERKKKDFAWVFKTLLLLSVAGSVVGSAGLAAVFWYFSKDLPNIISVQDYRPAGVSEIIALGADGKDTIVGEFYKERRYLVPFEKIPETVVNAFVAAEDDQFFQHQGVNPASILRAAIANFKAGHYVQGGSTITQQITKSLLLTPERNVGRKIKEVILAYRLERNLSKQQILYLYLNEIYLGHGAYGVQAAAKSYFDKDVSDATLAEAAMLAGMPTAPSKFSPHLNPKRAKERQLYVLRRMYENKFITQAQMAEAAAQPLRIYDDQDLNLRFAPHLVEHVRRYLIEKYGEKALFEEGLTVTVPFSADLVRTAERSLREGLRSIDKRIGFRGPVQQLKDSAEIEKYLREMRLKLVTKGTRYQLFLPDGRIDRMESMSDSGLKSDQDLLELNEIYPAVISSFDPKKKQASVLIGAAKGTLVWESVKWARLDQPGKALKRGDVVMVRINKKSDGEMQVGLEQEPQVQGALFSMEVDTGRVLAMVGGFDFGSSQFNRAVQAQRQPGSAFKPIIFAAAVEKGFTASSIVVDSPLVFNEGEDAGKWKPSNYEEKFYGDTTFRQALIKSRNIPTIKIAQAIQIPYLLDYVKRIGLNAQVPADLTASLGSGAASLLELTKAYSVFPRLGRVVQPIFLGKVVDRDGKVLEDNKPKQLPPVRIPEVAQASPVPSPENSGSPALGASALTLPTYPPADDPEQVMDPRVAYVMTHLMREVVNYGTGYEAKSLGRSAAGKTGTTSDYIDAWFIGFTPQVVTGVWIGHDSLQSMGHGESGAKAALPIWLSYMKEAVKPYPDTDFTVPPGIVFASVDAKTGKLAAPNSSTVIKEAYIDGTQPTESSGKEETQEAIEEEFLKETID